MTPKPVTPLVGAPLPGLPGVPSTIGPLVCPACDERAAHVHHVQDGHSSIAPTLICQGCGAVFELEAVSYNAGLGAGVLAEKARWEADR
jgi:hypothetical protein